MRSHPERAIHVRVYSFDLIISQALAILGVMLVMNEALAIWISSFSIVKNKFIEPAPPCPDPKCTCLVFNYG